MKNSGKLRGSDYYVALASKVLDKGTVMQDDFRKLIEQVDVELGFPKSGSYQKAIQDKFILIFNGLVDVIDIERDKADRGRGKSLKVKVFDFGNNTMTEIQSRSNEFFGKLSKGDNKTRPVKKAVVYAGNIATTATPSREDRAYRDAYVKKAGELKKKNPSLSQEQAVKEAKKSVKRISKEMIQKVWKLLIKVKYDCQYDTISSRVLHEVIKTGKLTKDTIRDWANQLQNYGVPLFVTITDDNHDRRCWAVQFVNSPDTVMPQLSSLAKETFGISLVDNRRPTGTTVGVQKRFTKLPGKVITNQDVSNLTPRVKYIIFVMGGMIKRVGRAIPAVNVSRVLRNNHYHPITVTESELFDIVSTFPEYFSRSLGDNQSIALAGSNWHETWTKLQKFNPKEERWNIPWLVNSGLELEKVKEIFPESYQMNKEIPGSKVYVVVADRSIESIIKLAKLQLQMRSCDYPILEENLVERLEKEAIINDGLLKALLLDKKQPNFVRDDSDTVRDKLLYQLEENYI